MKRKVWTRFHTPIECAVSYPQLHTNANFILYGISDWMLTTSPYFSSLKPFKNGSYFSFNVSLCSKYVTFPYILFQKSKLCIFNEFEDTFWRVLFLVDFQCVVFGVSKLPPVLCNKSLFPSPYTATESTGSVTIFLDRSKTNVNSVAVYGQEITSLV